MTSPQKLFEYDCVTLCKNSTKLAFAQGDMLRSFIVKEEITAMEIIGRNYEHKKIGRGLYAPYVE